jgi:hypothetical protein
MFFQAIQDVILQVLRCVGEDVTLNPTTTNLHIRGLSLMGLLGIGKNSNTCQHYKNNFHHKNLAFEKEGNGRQNGTYYGISLESYTYD